RTMTRLIVCSLLERELVDRKTIDPAGRMRRSYLDDRPGAATACPRTPTRRAKLCLVPARRSHLITPSHPGECSVREWSHLQQWPESIRGKLQIGCIDTPSIAEMCSQSVRQTLYCDSGCDSRARVLGIVMH